MTSSAGRAAGRSCSRTPPATRSSSSSPRGPDMPSAPDLRTNVLLRGGETAGEVSVTEIVVPPQTAGPPPPRGGLNPPPPRPPPPTSRGGGGGPPGGGPGPESAPPPQPAGPPLHTHDFAEAFYMLDGELIFQVEQTLETKRAGELSF